ncbi:prepilin-type N-terminal cleavage/methylation domain-containing protein [Candidatus Gracilibacteria bacterium]|nr:prepilin-type N-terminal cleavage/methylation domain-containing protein [Candidatus Gracilibacteria bacterium]
MIFSQKIRAFTLVELIVVITIIGILSTIGFVSYSNYLTGARDSNRVSQMVKLNDSIQVYGSNKSLPLPDDYIDITASGATNIIGYQGFLGVDVLETIDYTNGGTDPKDGTYYTYYVSKDRTSFQLLTLLEEGGLVSKNTFGNQANAVNYDERFVKVYGKKLGILTSTDPTIYNTPVQDISGLTSVDVVATTNTYIAHLSDTDKLEGTGTVLRAANPKANCKRLKQTGNGNNSGIYEINPTGSAVVSVYCDMEIAGGGWTLVARSVTGGTGTFNLTTNNGTLTNLNAAYTLASSNLKYSAQLFTSYSFDRVIDKSKETAVTAASLTSAPHTLSGSGITGGVANDGYNAKQGMLFVK